MLCFAYLVYTGKQRGRDTYFWALHLVCAATWVATARRAKAKTAVERMVVLFCLFCCWEERLVMRRCIRCGYLLQEALRASKC